MVRLTNVNTYLHIAHIKICVTKYTNVYNAIYAICIAWKISEVSISKIVFYIHTFPFPLSGCPTIVVVFYIHVQHLPGKHKLEVYRAYLR